MIIVVLTLVALVLSVILVLADALLNKEKIEDQIEKHLPGFNCGGCGYGSCHGMSCEILKDHDAYKKCRPLRNKEEMEEFLKEKGL